MTREDGGDAGDANARTDIAHEIEETGCVPDLLFRDWVVGDGSERNEEQSHRGALNDQGPEEVPVTDVKVEVREPPKAKACNQNAGAEKATRLDLAHQQSDERHRQE